MIDKKKILQETGQIIIWFALSVIFVYIEPFNLFKHFFFLIPLVLFAISKKDYFWIAFFFVLINAPAYFFAVKNQDAAFALPFYGAGGFSFTIFDFFLFIGFYKVFKNKYRKKLILNRPLIVFGLYFLIISIPISLVLGTSLQIFMNLLRTIVYYFLVVIILNLFGEKESFIKFGYLLLPFLILALVDQVLYLSFGERIIYLFDVSRKYEVFNSITGTNRGITTGVLMIFFLLIFGLQIYANPEYSISKNLGLYIAVLASSSFFLSATRSWIIIALTVLGIVVVFSKKSASIIFKMGITLSIILLIALSTNIIQWKMIDDVLVRMNVLSAVVSGETNKVDTYKDRLDNDIPKVKRGINQSPIFGVGLSKVYKQSYSNDVGYLNTILLWGYLGFLLFLFYIFIIIYKSYILLKGGVDKNTRNILIPLIGGIIAMLVGYLFTWDFFSFYPHKIFFVSLIFAYLEILYQDNKLGNVPINSAS